MEWNKRKKVDGANMLQPVAPVFFVLAIIGGFVAYWGIKGFVSNMVNQYTSAPG